MGWFILSGIATFIAWNVLADKAKAAHVQAEILGVDSHSAAECGGGAWG